MDSQEQLNKAIQTTDTIASAGRLQPDQVKKLWSYILEEDTDLFSKVTSQGFNGPSWEANRIGVGRRVGLAHEEATDPKVRRSVRHDKITMSPGHITVPFEISNRMFQGESIEGQNYENVVIALMASALRTELKQIALFGNKLGHAILPSEADFDGMSDSAGYIKDKYFAVQDGWLKQLKRTDGTVRKPATIFDAQNAAVSSQLFSQAFRALPQKYHKLGNSMRFMCSTTLDMLYSEKFHGRVDALGASAVTGTAIGNAIAPRMPLSLFDYKPKFTEHIVLNGTTPTALQYKYLNASDIVVIKSTLDSMQMPAYVNVTDYVVNGTNGTIARNGAGAIADGETVKVTYLANPMMVLVDPRNLILGYDLSEVRFLRGQNNYADTREYVMHLKVAFGVDDTESCVFVQNILKE